MFDNDRDMDSGDLLESAEQEALELLEGLSEREEVQHIDLGVPPHKGNIFNY